MLRLTSKHCAESIPKRAPAIAIPVHQRLATSKAASPPKTPTQDQTPKAESAITTQTLNESKKTPTAKKTIAQLDEEMKMKMSGLAGDGGESGVEYEDGQPVAMKRSVKNNMFRYI